MTETNYALIQIAIMAGITAVLRFMPFVLFPEGRKRPQFISYLGAVLPYAIIGMLVVYCFKNVSFVQSPHGLPELIAAACVVLLHVWKKNTLLSVFGGTAIYMILLRFVF